MLLLLLVGMLFLFDDVDEDVAVFVYTVINVLFSNVNIVVFLYYGCSIP